MRFSVYFEKILNTNNGYFQIEIMISAAHMLGVCSFEIFFERMVQFVVF